MEPALILVAMIPRHATMTQQQVATMGHAPIPVARTLERVTISPRLVATMEAVNISHAQDARTQPLATTTRLPPSMMAHVSSQGVQTLPHATTILWPDVMMARANLHRVCARVTSMGI